MNSIASSPHFSPDSYCGGGSGHAYFHEKVGIVKHQSVIFEENPLWRAHIFCANERKCLFFDSPPFQLSALPFFQGGEQVPQLAMGLFRRPVKLRAMGPLCEQCAKRFLLAHCCAAPSLQPWYWHNQSHSLAFR